MDKSEVISLLRACLISVKGGIKMEDLNRNFKVMTDLPHGIPYRDFGYRSLEDFLKNCDAVRISQKRGEWFVEAAATEQTKHIVSLISRQKTSRPKSKKARPIRKPANRYGGPNTTSLFSTHARNRYPNVNNTWSNRPVHHPPVNTSYRPGVNPQQRVRRPTQIVNPPSQHGPLRSLLEIPLVEPVPVNSRPRFMNTSSQNPPTSPSKRLKNIQSNQSANKLVISSKTVLNDDKQLEIKCLLNSNDKPKISTNLPPKVLSPLSPGQLVKNGVPPLPPVRQNVNPTGMNKVEVLVNAPKTPQQELKELVAKFKLPPPEYKVKPCESKNRKISSFYALVKIESNTYNTYPEESKTEEEAKSLAAQLALNALKEKYQSVNLKRTSDKNLMKTRIEHVMSEHPNGIFVNKLPVYYTQLYKESLPDDWLQVIEECSEINIDNIGDKQPILIKSSPQNARLDRIPKRTESRSSITRQCSNSDTEDFLSSKTDNISLNPIGYITPKKLKFPKEEFWIVYVTCVYSSVDIYGRLSGEEHSEKFESLMLEMEQFYGNKLESAKDIIVDHYYAVYDSDSWHRVQCLSYDSTTEQAEISFIDLGHQETFDRKQLYHLHTKFCSFPCQAFRMCLDGLEDLAECTTIVDTIESLLADQTYYVEVTNYKQMDQDRYARVVFYDTVGDEDVNLNTVLSEKIFENLLAVPKLDTKKRVTEVFVSHVETNGDIYIQIQSESLKYLDTLMTNLTCTGLNAEQIQKSMIKAIDKTKIYFFPHEGTWYRGKITNIPRTNEIQLYLIDYGRTVNVNEKNLIALEDLSETLAKYPPQALKVHLHNIEKDVFQNPAFVTRLLELSPYNESLLAKVEQPSQNVDAPPVVQLLKRMESGLLVSIGDSLQEWIISNSQGDGNNNKIRKRPSLRSTDTNDIDRSDVKTLNPPTIPKIGEYFDVYVTMAANPGNFTVQPFDRKALQDMMLKLQRTCESYTGPVPTAESLRPGQLYAGKHIDDHWYRVSLLHVICHNMMAVYFCDYGDYSVLSVEKLQPLQKSYLELPYQAIKAKLVGIEPVNKDWSVEDTIRFQKLVVDRSFVSEIMETNIDESTPCNTVLGLKLIDTETSKDIYIDRLLIEEGRAVQTS